MPERRKNAAPAGGKGAQSSNRSDAELLLPVLQAMIARAGLQVIGQQDGRVFLADASGRQTVLDTAELVAESARVGVEQWPGLIARHLNMSLEEILGQPAAKQSNGLAAHADDLLPCLKPLGAVSGSGAWHQRLVEGCPLQDARLKMAPGRTGAGRARAAQAEPALLLGIDLPDSIMYVTNDMMAQSGRPADGWLRHACQNLQRRTPDDWYEVLSKEDDVRWVTIQDDYGSSRALLLDELLPGAKRGWFVAPVGRDTLYFMPATRKAANGAVFGFYDWVQKEFAEAKNPISNEIYWIYRGAWYRFPIDLSGGVALVSPPEAFVRLFSADGR